MPIHLQLSPLLQHLWDNVWKRLPDIHRAYLNSLPLEVEQVTIPKGYQGRVSWGEDNKTIVLSLAAQIPDGLFGQFIIAHELAHIVSNHLYLSYLPLLPGWAEAVDPYITEACELLVDTLVFLWGFDQEMLAIEGGKLIHHPALAQWVVDYSSRWKYDRN